jgi:ankyrin repeat protein
MSSSTTKSNIKPLTVGDSCDVEAVTTFIANKGDVNAVCRDSPQYLKWTPLIAAAKDSSKCVELLLAAGANPNLKTADNKTALHIAASYWREASIRALLKAGADPSLKNNDGLTALDFAIATKAPENIVNLLKF